MASRKLTLWMTHCSRKKKTIQEGSPEELYDSPRISDFIACCRKRVLPWAILSAKHGLFFADEKKPNYNTTFRSDPITRECMVVENGRLLDDATSRTWLGGLALEVKKKLLSRSIKAVVFWPGQPRDEVDPLMRAKCYLKFLHKGADECMVEHSSWREIVDHINVMARSGEGRIVLMDRLPE